MRYRHAHAESHAHKHTNAHAHTDTQSNGAGSHRHAGSGCLSAPCAAAGGQYAGRNGGYHWWCIDHVIERGYVYTGDHRVGGDDFAGNHDLIPSDDLAGNHDVNGGDHRGPSGRRVTGNDNIVRGRIAGGKQRQIHTGGCCEPVTDANADTYR